MINIVGKVMLTDSTRGCQDEYAATLPVSRTDTKNLVFAMVSGQGGTIKARVNLNVRAAGE
jgi:hypothetical protein